MNKSIKIDIEEAKKVYTLLEDLNDFFHQEENYSNIKEFADQNYQRIHECYYKTVWNWLPESIKEDIENN